MARAGASGASFRPCCMPPPPPAPTGSSSKPTPIRPGHRPPARTWCRSTSSPGSWASRWTSGIASGRPSVHKPARASTPQTGGGAKQLVDRGKRVLALEATAVQRLADTLGPAFARAIEILAAAKGRVIVSGVGKSGLIARKIAATFTSTGTPAMFLHPVDSLHGDLGIVSRDDVGVVLSKSGASDVLLAEKRGTVAVVEGSTKATLAGVVTAGDLTRLMERTDTFLDMPVRDVMTKTPKATTAEELASAAVSLMERHGIMALPVLDGARNVVGIVHLHDLMKAGAV